MNFSPIRIDLAGYGLRGHKGGKVIRLFREHIKDECQYEHWADDWDEEDDASGWRCWA